MCAHRTYTTHPLEYGDGLPGEPDWVEDVVVEDALKEVVLVVGLEGRLPRHHLVHQHAQRPPVHRRTVVQLLQDLREGGRKRGLGIGDFLCSFFSALIHLINAKVFGLCG